MSYISFQPRDYFNTKLYTGNDTTQSITGVGFQPDWVWIKDRGASNNHELFDAVRGATKRIYTDTNDAQDTNSNSLTSFNSDGFSVGSNNSNNDLNHNYASWNWRASGTSGSSNTDGSVSATVSASATSGFSIVKYTNPSSGSPFTVGHGLGRPPKMVIIKNLSSSQTWGVYHASVGFGKYLRLDTSNGEASANLVTATSNTTFSTYQDHHSTGNELIAYCFADIQGHQKITSIYGAGDTANGSFCNLGFSPAFILTKEVPTSAGYNWIINDNKRIGYNPANKRLVADGLDVEADSGGSKGLNIDVLANGFKIRNNDGHYPVDNRKYLVYAVASNPLVSSNGVPNLAL